MKRKSKVSDKNYDKEMLVAIKRYIELSIGKRKTIKDKEAWTELMKI